MAIQKYNKEVMSHKTSHYAIYYIPPPLVGCVKHKKHKHTYLNNACSTMRGRIKGTDSTISAILATAVLYELRWKIWNGTE